MKKTKRTTNKKTVLIDNIYNYIKNNHEELELKPEQFQISDEQQDFTLIDKQNDLQQYKKDYSSKIDKQILIISQNIVNSLLALNNEKFTAFMSRQSVWGFDLTMQQFINDFYLVVKTDNMLRSFVLSHMDKIINAAKNVLEKYLITHMNEFRFKETRTDYNKKKLIDQMKQNQKQIEERLKNKDLNAKQNKKQEKDSTTTEDFSSTSTSSSSTTSPSTQATSSTTNTSTTSPAPGNIQITPFEAQVAGAEPNIPRILSMDQMMNMSDEDLQNINQIAQNNTIPPIENNMENVEVQPQTEEEAETETPEENEAPEENENPEEEEQQSEEEQNMEQQILNNLRRQHSNLQQGFTNNG